MYAGTFNQSSYTTQNPAVYKGSIDHDMVVLRRIAAAFACHEFATPIMNVLVDPGWLLSGTTLTSLGGVTTGTLTSGSPTITVADATGIVNGMVVTCADQAAAIPSNTTCTISGTTVTLSANAAVSLTNAILTFSQKSAAFVAPVTNPRIDRIVVDSSTGIMSIVAGTEAATPAAPAIPSGKLPVARILFATSTTSINNTMITDERVNPVPNIYVPVPQITVTGSGAHSTTAAVNTRYVTLNTGLETFNLPLGTDGAVIEIQGHGSGGWKAVPNTTDKIQQGNNVTTNGTGGGYLTSVNASGTDANAKARLTYNSSVGLWFADVIGNVTGH